MKRKRFSFEQIVAVLKQAELGMAVADIIRQVGNSVASTPVQIPGATSNIGYCNGTGQLGTFGSDTQSRGSSHSHFG